MHAPSSSKNPQENDVKTHRFCACSRLHTFFASLSTPHNGMQNTDCKALRLWSTLALFLVANLPVLMIVALCPHLPFQGMQADFMVFFIVVCELLMLGTAWKITGLFTKKIALAQEKYQACTQNLEENQKLAAIGRLASSVNHEINNPLAIINEKSGLAVDLLEFADDFPQRDRILNLLSSITSAVERCQGISQRMLHFSRRKEAVIENIDINALLTETASFLERETRTRGVHVACQCQANLPCIMSERGPLQQVFLNLLSNGLAALPESCNAQENQHLGEIGFSTHSTADMVLVTIHDNGSGMTTEVQKRLFEPFFSTKGDKGTGLGMYISQSIISRLGGTITMNSVLGQGTRFTISLPITPLLDGSDASLTRR